MIIKLGYYSNSQNGLIVSVKGVAPCMLGGGRGHDSDVPKILIKQQNNMIAQIDKRTGKAEYFGIRKLTPRECFRLMDVSDEDFDKLLATDENGKRLISNSALYKLAGNSIVENCLCEIYKRIWLSEDAPQYQMGDQLTLSF